MLYRIVDFAISVYTLGLVVYSVLSWFRGAQTDKVRAWLARFYEPILKKLRSVIKPLRIGNSMLDVTPVLFLLALMVVKRLVVYLLPRGL
jgi:YggT family protein